MYKHLFRHYADISFDSWLRCTSPTEFLYSVGYTSHDMEVMSKASPKMLETLDVHSQLAPKIRFLVETLGGGIGQLTWKKAKSATTTTTTSDDDDSSSNDGITTMAGRKVENGDDEDDDECEINLSSFEEDESTVPHNMRLFETTKNLIPASYFNPSYSLDRHIGPCHAYLSANGLIHGPELLKDIDQFGLFIEASKNIGDFVELCQEWESSSDDNHHHKPKYPHTIESVQSFLYQFGQGLIPASKHYPQFVPTLLESGANPYEYDNQGLVPLLWCSGSGHLASTQRLFEIEFQDQLQLLEQEQDEEQQDQGDLYYRIIDTIRDPKEGATPFHWACCGINNSDNYGDVNEEKSSSPSPYRIGSGGSFDLCEWMLDQVEGTGGGGRGAIDGEEDEVRQQQRQQRIKDLISLPTWTSQSTPIMWASWSGSLDIVKLLVERWGGDDDNGFDNRILFHKNSRNETALHWAASAGHLHVCQYIVLCNHRHEKSHNQHVDQSSTPSLSTASSSDVVGLPPQEAVDMFTNQIDQSGRTPYDYAKIYKRQNIIDWIDGMMTHM